WGVSAAHTRNPSPPGEGLGHTLPGGRGAAQSRQPVYSDSYKSTCVNIFLDFRLARAILEVWSGQDPHDSGPPVRRAAMIDADHTQAPPGSSGGTRGGSKESRRNSLKNGLRARIVFPRDLEERIAERTAKLMADMTPANELEEMLIGEMART